MFKLGCTSRTQIVVWAAGTGPVSRLSQSLLRSQSVKNSVCQIQNLCVYHDALPTSSCYNESVSQGTIPVAFGFLDF
jgi:hypothetical protein